MVSGASMGKRSDGRRGRESSGFLASIGKKMTERTDGLKRVPGATVEKRGKGKYKYQRKGNHGRQEKNKGSLTYF